MVNGYGYHLPDRIIKPAKMVQTPTAGVLVLWVCRDSREAAQGVQPRVAAKQTIKSEDGLSVLPDDTIDHLDLDAYDSLILPGAMDIREAIENERIIDFIKKFEGKTIGAISIAPLLLVRAGLLNGKPFMAGINKEEVFEEGFSESDLAEMVGWDDNLSKPVEAGYIITGNIITSVSYNFVKWALAFGKMVGIDISAKTFGIQ